MRLFVAVLFSPDMKAALLESIARLRQEALSGNFTRPENLHLTLAFIGEWADAAGVRRALDRINPAPFPLRLCGGGHFGRLYWAGLEKSTALTDLAAQAREQLAAAGIPFDAKPFSPHITLARQVQAPAPLKVTVASSKMTVARLSLMSSRRQNGKLVYTEIYGKTLS